MKYTNETRKLSFDIEYEDKKILINGEKFWVDAENQLFDTDFYPTLEDFVDDNIDEIENFIEKQEMQKMNTQETITEKLYEKVVADEFYKLTETEIKDFLKEFNSVTRFTENYSEDNLELTVSFPVNPEEYQIISRIAYEFDSMICKKYTTFILETVGYSLVDNDFTYCFSREYQETYRFEMSSVK